MAMFANIVFDLSFDQIIAIIGLVVNSLQADVWEAWEDYMGKILKETRLRHLWQTERGYYSSGFRRFVDQKVGLSPDTPVMPPLPRPTTGSLVPPRSGDDAPPQVAR